VKDKGSRVFRSGNRIQGDQDRGEEDEECFKLADSKRSQKFLGLANYYC